MKGLSFNFTFTDTEKEDPELHKGSFWETVADSAPVVELVIEVPRVRLSKFIGVFEENKTRPLLLHSVHDGVL